jgi:hypothetical protein
VVEERVPWPVAVAVAEEQGPWLAAVVEERVPWPVESV